MPPSRRLKRDNDAGTQPIIVFDALCLLCSANARFVLKHDRREYFLLASMQSGAGAALYHRFGMDPSDPETLILVDGDRVLRNSDAVLRIYAELGWPWKAASAFRLVPRPVRDALYLWIARNRYRLFGKLETCWLPSADQARRLL